MVSPADSALGRRWRRAGRLGDCGGCGSDDAQLGVSRGAKAVRESLAVRTRRGRRIRGRIARAAAPKPKKQPVVNDNDDDLTLELLSSGAAKKPKPSVKSPTKPGGSGKPVTVASLPATALPPGSPAKPGETTPPKPGETIPAKPGETTPAKPPETTPAKPGETTPAKPAETTPPKPAETTPAPTPPPPKAEIKAPLGELPKVVDLPAADSAGPFPVGKISTPAGASGSWRWLAAMRFSRTPGPQLVLQEKDAGSDKASWQVVLSDSAAAEDSKESVAAKFFRDGDSLAFQWATEADQAATGALHYCALAVQVGDDKKTVGLIKPKVGAAIAD